MRKGLSSSTKISMSALSAASQQIIFKTSNSSSYPSWNLPYMEGLTVAQLKTILTWFQVLPVSWVQTCFPQQMMSLTATLVRPGYHPQFWHQWKQHLALSSASKRIIFISFLKLAQHRQHSLCTTENHLNMVSGFTCIMSSDLFTSANDVTDCNAWLLLLRMWHLLFLCKEKLICMISLSMFSSCSWPLICD